MLCFAGRTGTDLVETLELSPSPIATKDLCPGNAVPKPTDSRQAISSSLSTFSESPA